MVYALQVVGSRDDDNGAMTVDDGAFRRRVLLIPGGASTVYGYFPDLADALAPTATLLESDPPGIGVTSDGRPLRLADYAAELARTVRERGDDPVGVIGHSLGGLVAQRLAVDEPHLVAALLLLDPTPVTPWLTLRVMAPSIRMLAAFGPIGRWMWMASARRDVRNISMSAEQERAFAVYTDPRFVDENARWAKHLVRDGSALANDIAVGKLGAVPTTVVSAHNRSAKSSIRRAHERLVGSIPGAELVVWDGTSHPLHIQQPAKVAAAMLALLDRT
jgi:pimeloyl-ACP methyl ester carboxylesterase